jgi:hypothetical protein
MSSARTSRRNMLASAGLALVSGALPRTSARVAAGTAPAGGSALIVLQDPQLPLPQDVQRQLDAGGARVIDLEADPVRMWRGGQAHLLAAASTRLLGVTTWPKFLLVRGLAEESGRRVRQQRLDAASGAIIWLIA